MLGRPPAAPADKLFMQYCRSAPCGWEQGAKWNEPAAGSKYHVGTGFQLVHKCLALSSLLSRKGFSVPTSRGFSSNVAVVGDDTK